MLSAVFGQDFGVFDALQLVAFAFAVLGALINIPRGDAKRDAPSWSWTILFTVLGLASLAFLFFTP